MSSKSHGDITLPSQSTSFSMRLQIKTQQAKINQYYEYNESGSQQALIHLYTCASDTYQAEQAGNMLFRYLLLYSIAIFLINMHFQIQEQYNDNHLKSNSQNPHSQQSVTSMDAGAV